MSAPTEASVSLSRREKFALAFIILLGGALLFWWLPVRLLRWFKRRRGFWRGFLAWGCVGLVALSPAGLLMITDLRVKDLQYPLGGLLPTLLALYPVLSLLVLLGLGAIRFWGLFPKLLLRGPWSSLIGLALGTVVCFPLSVILVSLNLRWGTWWEWSAIQETATVWTYFSLLCLSTAFAGSFLVLADAWRSHGKPLLERFTKRRATHRGGA